MPKNALLLHGTNGNSQDNWIPWLVAELEKKGYQIWSPDLPHAEEPNIARYNTFLLGNENWSFDQESIIVGHSSGAVASLGLLQQLPKDTKIKAVYLVGSFKDSLGWEDLKHLFEPPLNFEKIKTKAEKFVFIHSDNDPYCPLDHAEYLAKNVNGQLLVEKGQYHFSVKTAGERYREFPLLLDLIAK